MKKVESKVVQDFIGTINDKTIYNEELYTTTVYLVGLLYSKLKDMAIPKEEEFIDDFIDSISNIYKSSDATIVDISDAIEESIGNFNPKIDKLYELEFYMFEEYMDEKLTNKYFSFINHRLASDYYLTE